MFYDLFRFNRVFSCRVVEQYLSRWQCVFDINAHLYDFHIAVHMRRYLSSFTRIVVLCAIGTVNRIHVEVNKRQRHLSIHCFHFVVEAASCYREEYAILILQYVILNGFFWFRQNHNK